MKFAINYSPQASQLLQDGQITIDFFKCPPWPDMVSQALKQRPVAVHFELKAGDGKLGSMNLKKVRRFLQKTGTPYVNLHLEVEKTDISKDMEEADETLCKDKALELMFRDIQSAVRRFGSDKVIVENVPFRGKTGKVMRYSVEPDLINQLVSETGCGFLMDISHARIAARHLEMDERAYMDQLPTHKLKELHFTGLHNFNGYWQDHLEALEDDWVALDWVLGRIREGAWSKPWILAFEYGRVGEKFAWRSDSKVIAAQVPLISARIADI